ncbi:uncharacterized protein LOC113351361 [Papaver somniferum]|uniref:uncharacterized protein LOC113351361 n=1 Tax=Papaver somniferum TaxID=3469 RepID=UPI000E7056F9|nr:uncharacterized protein LOC113351361 [Papaver somniferum]
MDTIIFNNLVTARGVQEVLLEQQKQIIQQKSGVLWLKEGASNSRFFHENLKVSQAKNDIMELEHSNGSIVANQDEIMANILVSHFENKFKHQEVHSVPEYFQDITKVVTEEDNLLLDATPTDEEIKKAVFELDPDSAPGPDGFAGWFYREAWEIIGKDFATAINFFLSRGFIPSGLNSNFLLLFPKVKNAKRENQFAPIGLMNFIFKVITNIITIRLWVIIQKIVSHQQAAFIKGRNIQDQIVLASELVNELDTPRRGGNIGLKLDITQDYDSLRWEFLFQVMIHFGFSEKGISWFHTLLKSAKISVLLDSDLVGWPKKVLKERERIIRNFLWTGDPATKKLITVNWDSVCSPLSEGVLGLRRLEIINRALLMNLYWRIQNGTSEMAKYFQDKYQNSKGGWIEYYKNHPYGQG